MDLLTPEQRSANMARIRSTDTGPEIVVRKSLHRLGYRFRLHRRDLPGRPDLVLPRFRTAVFVHGCYWHRHEGCRLATTPKTNQSFWLRKFENNRARDRRVEKQLRDLQWNVVVIWECEASKPERLEALLRQWLPPRM